MSGTLQAIETAIGALGTFGASGPVVIGSLTLTGYEVPDVLRVGGEQDLIVHKLPGGARVIQAMGADPASLTLAGKFMGATAATRARQLQAMRDAGTQVSFTAAGIALQVVVASFTYDYGTRGFVIPYTVTLEIVPQLGITSSLSSASLSSLVGTDLAGAITSVTATLGTVSTYSTNVLGQVSSVTGQITPIATLVGAGGFLAHAQDSLTLASGVATAGVNLASAPAAAASLIGNLQSAGSSLMSTISSAGGNLVGISAAAPSGSIVTDAPSLAAASANAGALAAAVTTGGYVNRSLDNAALATGATPAAPVVHA